MKIPDLVARRSAWLIFILFLGAGAYGGWWLVTQNSAPKAKVSLPAKIPGSSLNNVTLTEVDKNGKLLWEIKAERAEYNQEGRIAKILKVSGKFFQDGKPIIEATGEGGSVNQSNREITISGDVRGIALKDKITLKADRMFWQPDKDLLTATGNIKVEKVAAKIAIVGKTLKAKLSSNLFTIEKNVVATSVNPPIKLESTILTWDADRNKVISPNPFRIVHTKDDFRIRSDKGEWNIGQQQVTLEGKVRARAIKSDFEVNTPTLIWDIGKKIVTLPDFLKATSATRDIAIAANRGQIDLSREQIVLRGQIQTTSKIKQIEMTADAVEWIVPSQTITAEGNVNYHQAEKNVNVRGDKAVTNLADRTIQVTGGDVITQVTP